MRRLLKKNGANVNEADSIGSTPLIIAAVRDFLDVVEFLVIAEVQQVAAAGYV